MFAAPPVKAGCIRPWMEGSFKKVGKANMLQGEKTVWILYYDSQHKCAYEAMSVVKEYNLPRHFDTKHRY